MAIGFGTLISRNNALSIFVLIDTATRDKTHNNTLKERLSDANHYIRIRLTVSIKLNDTVDLWKTGMIS